MKQSRVIVSVVGLVVIVAAGPAACTGSDDVGVSVLAHGEGPPPNPNPPRPCRLTGGGRIEWGESPDSFGGNAQPFDGDVDGEWNHVTHDGLHFHGDPDHLECFTVPGAPARPPRAPANAISFGGTGTLDGEDGCTFDAYAEDHGEPGTADFYSISVVCPSGATAFAGATLLDGNLQIHAVPPNR